MTPTFGGDGDGGAVVEKFPNAVAKTFSCTGEVVFVVVLRMRDDTILVVVLGGSSTGPPLVVVVLDIAPGFECATSCCRFGLV